MMTCPLFELQPFELLEWFTTYLTSCKKIKQGYILRAPNMYIRTNKSFVPIKVHYFAEEITFSLMNDKQTVKVSHGKINPKY